MDNPTNNPFGNRERQRPRFSLSTMLLVVVINAAICVLLLLASKVPAISQQISRFTGQPSVSSEQAERTVHFLFLMACYCTPLVVTGVLSLLYKLAIAKSNQYLDSNEESDPFTDELATSSPDGENPFR